MRVKWDEIQSVGFGGGCHWCTEAVFENLKGVIKVDQGWVASNGMNKSFSEAVIVIYNEAIISLEMLIEIHLITHASESNHSMREKYRSAIYTFNKVDKKKASSIIEMEKKKHPKLITEVLDFVRFKRSDKAYLNYYKKNPEAPFCVNYIDPKLKRISNSHKNLIK